MDGHLFWSDECPLMTQSGYPAGCGHSGLVQVKSGRSVSAGSKIGKRSVGARLAIDRRGLRLRWIEAVRCGVALSIDVDGLCL
jgi:hypothetical protein